MLDVTRKYIEACESPIRSSYIIAKYGLFNKEAKQRVSVVVSANQPFSNSAQTYDEIKDTTINYISCEPNRVKLDNSFAFISDKTKININQNLGIWSLELSDENGNFSTPFEITYTFNKEIDFTLLTLHFQEVVKDFDIYYYLNDELVYTTTISNNNLLIVETKEEVIPMAIFNKLVLSIKSTNEPYRFVKFNEIDFGVYQTFRKEDIESLEIIDELSIDSNDMVSNSCQLTIKDKNGDYDIINPYNKLKLLQEKQELTIYHNLKVGLEYKEVPLGTFLMKEIDYQGKELTLMCYDDRYFMNKIYYGSKFYINTSITTVLEDLFNYFGYAKTKYEIDSELNSEVINGYIPFVTFGEALRLICESCGAVISKTRYGITYIFKTYDDNSIKLFKNGEYDKSSPKKNLYNNVIDINEYNYVEQSDNVILYNGTLSKGTHLIMFDKAPIIYRLYNSDYNSLKVDTSNTNYNIINLYASACEVEVLEDDTIVNLQGKVYTTNVSTKRIMKEELANVDEYAIKKVDNKLINSTNSNEIAMWKLNKREIKYNFEVNSMPYIEVGDTCKIQLPYKTISGNSIKRMFVPTKITFNLGVKQTIEGE